MKSLLPHEILLEGKWEQQDGEVKAEAICQRIFYLTEKNLSKLGNDTSGGKLYIAIQ